MKIKILEIRDRATMIPVLALKLMPENDIQRYYLSRYGYAVLGGEPAIRPVIVVMNLASMISHSDPYDWNSSRTMTTAHLYIEKNFDKLSDGDVVDVQFILKETAEAKISERITYPL